MRSSTSSTMAGCAIRWSGCARSPACWRASPSRTPTRGRDVTAWGGPQTPGGCLRPRTRGSRGGLLPGDEPLAARHERWRAAMLVPSDQIERTVARVIEEARAQTRGLVELPAGEGVVLEIVREKPWLGFNFYLGCLQGRVAINIDLPMSGMDLLLVAIHETYPGHQAERAIKEHLLVRGRGLLEEAVVLVPTPQSLVSEGIGRLAPSLLLEGDRAAAFAALIGQASVEF